MKSGWKRKRSSLFHRVVDHIRVTKIFVSLGITLSALAGYLLFYPVMDGLFWLTAWATFLLCCGCGALNNYQDRRRDKFLARTANRPLPSGRLLPRTVLFQAVILIVFGMFAFCFTRNPFGSVVAAFGGVVFYNGIYTPLKSRTLLAIVPGSICGMLPPLMGWLAAGGGLYASDSSILFYNASVGGISFVMLLIGVWQFPHFWLILLNHGRDYSGSSLPSMLSFLTESQLRRILLIWIFLYCVIMMMTPFWLVGFSGRIQWFFIANAMTLFLLFSVSHIFVEKRFYRMEFMLLNASMVLFIFTLVINQLFFY